MLADGLAELFALQRVIGGNVEHALALAHGHRAHMDAPAVEHLHRGAEPLMEPVRPAKNGAFRHAHIIKDHVRGFGAALAQLAVGLGHRDARRVRRHDEGRHAIGAVLFGIGAGKHREDPGAHRVGDVALGAVDHEIAAIAPRRGADAARIGPVVGFGQREGGDDIAAGHAGQPAFLLRLRAVHHDALRADADIGADQRAEGQRGITQRLDQPRLLRHVEPDAAKFLGRGQAEQAHLLHLRHDLFGDGVLFLDAALRRDQPLAGESLHAVHKLFKYITIHTCRHRSFLPWHNSVLALI